MINYSVSILISTYNWPEALELALKSVLRQTVLPSEILIADDGSDERTKKLIDSFKQNTALPIKHYWHEDKGFRKTIIMNQTLSSAAGEYIIQIDGDIIIHPRFIEDHLKEASSGHYIKGSRAMLSAARTDKILKTKNINIHSLSAGVGSRVNATYFPPLAPLFKGDNFRSNNVRGCNFSFWKKDFIAVNGYNNDLEGWGHEDIELAARLTNLGIKQRQLKLKAICFHLYHKINERHQEDINYQKYLDVVKNHAIRCKNGIIQD